jgi:subtilisin family serine protease
MLKKVALGVLLLLLSGLLAPYSAPAGAAPQRQGAEIDPALQAVLKNQSPGQKTAVIVILADQFDPKTVTGKDQEDIRKNLISALQKKADSSQLNLRSLLQTRRAQGAVQNFTPLWIQNAIATNADQTVINEMAQRPEVARIILDETFSAPAKAAPTKNGPALSAAEANISKIKAPDMWSLGFTGQNVVIASLDSGVDNTHPDLAAQWRGGSNSWYDPYGQHTTPTDISGHGTETMGVMVGRSSGGSSIGVAPDAKWIAAKIFNDAGQAQAIQIHLAFQWVLDPDGNLNTADAPKIVNNSWASNMGGCSTTFQADLQALVAAGIVPVFAAGNFGALSSSPANNPEAFAVGNTNNNDVIASDSSRGPTSCGSGATSRTWPSVVAPGVNIRTSDPDNLYFSYSGTSLAAPHVSGAMALLLSANSNLTVSQLENALTSTAVDLGTAGTDNTYGAGRIDMLAACHSLGLCNTADPYLVTTANDTGGGQGTLTYALSQAAAQATANNPVTIHFGAAVTTYTVTTTLPTVAAYVTVDGGCNNGTPKVDLIAGAGAGSNGLATTSNGNTTIKGLAITGFSGYGLSVRGANNQLQCTWIGIKKNNAFAKNTTGAVQLLAGGRLEFGLNGVGYGNRIHA